MSAASRCIAGSRRCRRQPVAPRMPVIVLFEGWDVAGKGPCIAALTQALDPRGFKAWPIHPAQAHELDYPWLWRFWQKLPPRGEIAIFDRSWYRRPLVDRIEGMLSEDDCRLAVRDIVDLERTLADDGYVVVKIWLHIGQDEQRRRLRLRAKHDPGTRQARSLAQNRRYEEYLLAAEETLARHQYRRGAVDCGRGDRPLLCLVADLRDDGGGHG